MTAVSDTAAQAAIGAAARMFLTYRHRSAIPPVIFRVSRQKFPRLLEHATASPKARSPGEPCSTSRGAMSLMKPR